MRERVLEKNILSLDYLWKSITYYINECYPVFLKKIQVILSLIHFMVVINLELVVLDPNSPRAIEFWTFHPRKKA
ncbi:UNVERIFIED_CONTAM: hypothetical protein NCL1_14077 [Trichonephila clavipes]